MQENVSSALSAALPKDWQLAFKKVAESNQGIADQEPPGSLRSVSETGQYEYDIV